MEGKVAFNTCYSYPYFEVTKMRSHVYLTGNEALKPILYSHKISQSNLYHYTKKETAKKIIEKREFRLTRADKFLDSEEIQYGLRILREIAEQSLEDGIDKSFIDFIDTIGDTLAKCYVLCLSHEANNKYLLDTYSDGKTVIKLDESFTDNLMGGSWQYMPKTNGRNVQYTSNLYTSHEGFVVYQESEQKDIAKKICDSFKNLLKNNFPGVDIINFRGAVAKFIILCKVEKYYKEEEYRIALISNNEESNEFEIEENNRVFITLGVSRNLKFELLEINI